MRGTRRRGLANHVLVALIGSTVWLLAAVALVALAAYERDRHLGRVQERNVLLTRLFADHATRSIDGAGLVASTLADLIGRGMAPGGAEMQATLANTLVSLPFLRGIGLVDAQGRIVGSADREDLGQPVELARLGRAPPPGGDLLGRSMAGRRLADLGPARAADPPAAGVSFLPLQRRASLPDGTALRIVVLINVDALLNFQQTMLGDMPAVGALLAYDGHLLGATRGVALAPGADLSGLPPFRQFLPEREHGHWQGAGLRDGEQLAAFRVSRTRPLLAWIEFDGAAARAEWWRASRGPLAMGLAALLFIAAMTALAVRSLRARDQAQQAVAQRERELAITLQSLQELVFRCDAQGALSFVNAQWRRAMDVDEEHSLGRPLTDWAQPVDRAAVAALFDPALPVAASQVRQARAALVDAQGLPRSYDLSVMPLLQGGRLAGFAGSAVDVTERVMAQRRLEQQLAFSEMLLESSPLPMSVMSRERRYLIVNRAWENFTGKRREQVVGREVGAHLPVAERRVHEEQDARVYATQAPVRYDVRVPQADGSLRDLVVEKRALPGEDGQAAGILAVLIDVTEFREAERATREARDVAEEASRSKSEFIANISHELRTPLQSIIGFSELGLRRAGEQARLAGMFDDIHASGQRMLSLVNDLLDVSRLESTVGTIHLERTDLRGLVRSVLRELQPLAAQRQQSLVATLSEQTMRAKVDPLRFQQVVRNVVANALKFSPPGSRIDVLGEATPEGRWRIRVADRGPGIPEAELERIFEAFVQSSRTKDGSGGTGLGLAICRKIMQAHDGDILARAREGGGAVFDIELPGAPADTQPAAL